MLLETIKHLIQSSRLNEKRCIMYPLFIIILSFLASTTALGQDYTKWGLPENATLRIGKGSVGKITFSPDGKRLYAVSSIGIWTYDAYTGKELDLIPLNYEHVFGVSPYMDIYLCLGSDNTVQVRNLTDNSIKITLKSDTPEINKAVFSPDGHTFADVNDNEIRLWDLTTGEQKATLVGNSDWIRALVFSPDGTKLASRGSDNTLRLWDVQTATHIKTLSEYASDIWELIFSRDGNTLISDNQHAITFWDINTGLNETISTPSVRSMVVSLDGKTLITAGYQGMFMWDYDTAMLKRELMLKGELSGHKDGIGSIAVSPDGSTMASCSSDEIFLWDIKSSARKMAIPGHTRWIYSMALSADGNTLATANREEIHLMDPKTLEYKGMLYVDVDDWNYNSSLAFSPDGNILACQSGKWTLLWDIENGILIGTLKGFGGWSVPFSSAAASVAFSPDGNFLVGAHDSNTAIHLWAAGRTHVAALDEHRDGVRTIDLSFDGKTIASGSNDHTVKLWDVASRKNSATLIGHSDEVLTVAFNNDASILASGSKDKTIILWDVSTGEQINRLNENTYRVNSLTFSQDGGTLVSSGGWKDNIIRLWDVASGEQKAVLEGHRRGVRDVIFVPDGRTLISGGVDGTVLFWDVTPFIDTPVRLAEDVNRDGTVDIQDLIFVASQFGQTVEGNIADINKDGVVNVEDILLVAAILENDNNAAPQYLKGIESLTAAQVDQWLMQARRVNTNTQEFKKGIAVLEQLLGMLIPKVTKLLPNYPNPFNPETWIPYQIASSTEVKLHIYSFDGRLVRTLELGHQQAGLYQNRNKAAYWNGKNEYGEQVASGIYYYTLSAGRFTATRRMVILK